MLWKRLEHSNIVPLLGITSTPLRLISEWVLGGGLTKYIKEHPNADWLTLVGIPPPILDDALIPS